MTSFDNLKPGDKLSETTYYEVISKNVNGIHGYSLNVKTSTGQQISITKDIVEKSLLSADQYDREDKVTMTELATILSNTNGKVFTVEFQKQPDKKDISLAIQSLNKGSFPSNSQIEATVGLAYNGNTRVLRGYLLSVEPLMGRAKVVDLEVKFSPTSNESGIRLVDLRHINYLIFEQVKYSLKK